RNVIAEPSAPMQNIEKTADRSWGVSNTSSAMSGVCPDVCRLCDQAKNACTKKMPQTIIIGAGDISTTLKGAPDPASNGPHFVRVLAPMLTRNTDTAAKTTPALSMLTPDRPLMGFSLPLST